MGGARQGQAFDAGGTGRGLALKHVMDAVENGFGRGAGEAGVEEGQELMHPVGLTRAGLEADLGRPVLRPGLVDGDAASFERLVDAAAVAKLRADIDQEISAAVELAERDPPPDPASAVEDVFRTGPVMLEQRPQLIGSQLY